MFPKSLILNTSCRFSPGLKEWSLCQEKCLNSQASSLDEMGWFTRKRKLGTPRSYGGLEEWGEHSPGPNPSLPPCPAPWHTAKPEKPGRHSGTLQLLSDPKYLKMGALTRATRRRSGMNWRVVKMANLSLFSQEKYLFH